MAAKYVNTTDIISNMWLWEICGMESLNKYYTKWWKVMKSVFQKCLRKDFGKHEYKRYVALSRRELKGQKPNELSFVNKPVYQRMYRHLMAESPDRRAQRAEGLLKALYKALRIGQRFVPVTIVYVIANFLLIGLKLDYVVTCISLAVLGISFLYKLTEYLTNRYCFIDAYLVMVYRAVLEKLNS